MMSTTVKRIAKNITNPKDVEYFLNLNEDTMQRLSFMMETFGTFNGKQKFHPYDTITIPKGVYGKTVHNTNEFTTTLGLWIFNRFFIEPELDGIFGYINKPINKKVYGQMNKDLSYAILEGKATIQQLKHLSDKIQKYQPYVSVLSANHTDGMLTIGPKINKRKKELLNKYSKEIAARDGKIVNLIEQELLQYARELLKDDPSIDIYDSGAIGSFENNFKNMFIMKGAVQDPNDPDLNYNIITSCLMDGISKEEYSKFANGLAAGPYARSQKTASGGYMEKLFLRALQHVTLDVPGSDCGTDRFILVHMDNKNLDNFMYSYIIENGKLVELTADKREKYLGKTVKLRFSALCEHEHICNKCAGNLFYRLGVTNVGVATPQFVSKIKLRYMKAFHDSVVQYSNFDDNMIAEAFGF